MKLYDVQFTDIYHNYQLIEADFLTDLCKEKVAVSEDDCLMLTTTIVDEQGYLQFEVLSIGPSFKECTKGLELKESLARIDSYTIENYSFEFVSPPLAALAKSSFIFGQENCPQKLLDVRKMTELNQLRDIHQPDLFPVHFFENEKHYNYFVRGKEYDKNILTATVAEEPIEAIGLHQSDSVEVIPVLSLHGIELFDERFSIQIGGETKTLRELIQEFEESLGSKNVS